jgi:hypothetical protein
MDEDKPIRTFRVKVVTVPPRYEVELGVSKVREEVWTIKGRTLAEAKRIAGIQ